MGKPAVQCAEAGVEKMAACAAIRDAAVAVVR
jgi:hypothetical protein